MRMFIVYGLNQNDMSVTIHGKYDRHTRAVIALDEVAVEYINLKGGKERAQNAYKDDTPIENITDGYYLKTSKEYANRIDVYKKETKIILGTIWNWHEVSNIKVLQFGVSEYFMSNTDEIDTVPYTQYQYQPPSHHAIGHQSELIKELRAVLALRPKAE